MNDVLEVKDFIESVTKEVDLENKTELQLSKKLPTIIGRILKRLDQEGRDFLTFKEEYEKLYVKRYRYYRDEADEDIFTTVKEYKDRILLIKRSTKELSDVGRKKSLASHNMKMLENLLAYVKEINFTIKNLNDFSKMRNGI